MELSIMTSKVYKASTNTGLYIDSTQYDNLYCMHENKPGAVVEGVVGVDSVDVGSAEVTGTSVVVAGSSVVTAVAQHNVLFPYQIEKRMYAVIKTF